MDHMVNYSVFVSFHWACTETRKMEGSYAIRGDRICRVELTFGYLRQIWATATGSRSSQEKRVSSPSEKSAPPAFNIHVDDHNVDFNAVIRQKLCVSPVLLVVKEFCCRCLAV